MFRRIFGIRKKSKNPQNDPLRTSGAVTLEELTHTSDSYGSVVPLHASQTISKKKKEPAEVFNEAVEKLVEKLEGINDNLTQQVQQNQQLVKRIDLLPDMLSSLPEAVEEQRQAFANVARQLEAKVERDEKVAEALGSIHEKVAASVEIDAQMNESIGKFSNTLSKLDQDTACQTQWLEQICRTFTTSERYMKHTLAKQQNRFYWVFGISMGICFLAIAGLLIGIMFLVNK